MKLKSATMCLISGYMFVNMLRRSIGLRKAAQHDFYTKLFPKSVISFTFTKIYYPERLLLKMPEQWRSDTTFIITLQAKTLSS